MSGAGRSSKERAAYASVAVRNCASAVSEVAGRSTIVKPSGCSMCMRPARIDQCQTDASGNAFSQSGGTCQQSGGSNCAPGASSSLASVQLGQQLPERIADEVRTRKLAPDEGEKIPHRQGQARLHGGGEIAVKAELQRRVEQVENAAKMCLDFPLSWLRGTTRRLGKDGRGCVAAKNSSRGVSELDGCASRGAMAGLDGPASIR